MWPRLLVPPHIAPFEAGSGTLREAIREGSVVPFLGAGASSLRSTSQEPDQEAWAPVAQRLDQIYAHLRTKKDAQFLRSFAESYKIPLSGPKEKVPPAPAPDTLFQFQLALIRLTSNLISAFSSQMERTRQCICHIDTYSVPSNEKIAIQLRPFLKETLISAYKLKAMRDDLFESEAICKRVAHLSFELLDEKVWKEVMQLIRSQDRSIHIEIENNIRMLRYQGLSVHSRGKEIQLAAIEWLTELLWYTFRFRVPAYPTTAELAFQLSLCALHVPPRRGELAQAAEAVANYTDLVEKVKDWFEYCDGKMKKQFSQFHLSIAAALKHAYSLFEKRKDLETLRLRRSKGFEAPSRGGSPPAPIGFTTNFDKALERAFEALNFDYYVVFPVFGKRLGKLGRSESQRSDDGSAIGNQAAADGKRVAADPLPPIQWLCKSVGFERGKAREKYIDIEDLPEICHAPIIVKFHGSPLERLPEAVGSRYEEFAHCIVLSESVYLEMIFRQESEALQWIKEQLRTPAVGDWSRRGLWFFGYSISDWNIRLSLYEHLHLREEMSFPPTSYAINREFDRYQSALFGRLKVYAYEGELNGVAEIVRKIPEIDRLLTQHGGASQ